MFESYSAGTETKPKINQDAVRLMKELYGIDMEKNGQYSKLISDIPEPDIAISMGCNVECPFIGRPFDDNWGFFNPFSVEILQKVFARVMESYYENPREMLMLFYYPSDEYVSFLMTQDSLMFSDEIDCRDLFPGNDPREKILIFEIV